MFSSFEQIRRLKSAVYVKVTILVAMFLLEVSCATHTKPTATESLQTEAAGKRPVSSHSDRIEQRLRDEYTMWEGMKHRMGGTGRTGVDCSGFVRAVYKNVFNVDLPRTTKDQVRKGVAIRRYELQVGDLVFFRPPSYPRHVGIYLSKNEFLHASKMKGVIISRIDPNYWGKYYWTARRIFPKN